MFSRKRTKNGSTTTPALRSQIEEVFDTAFYLEINGDVREAGVDPINHYLEFGWREGRNPSPVFETGFYIAQHLGPDDSDTCPLVHYVTKGRAAGLIVSNTDARDKLRKTQDKVWSDWFRQLLTSLHIDTSLFSADLFHRIVLPMFSPDDYRVRRGLAADLSDVELLTRYLAFDFATGLPPGPLFDPAHYRSQIGARGLPPLGDDEPAFLHWLKHGLPRQVVPTPFFSDKTYLKFNKDLERFPEWPFVHWLRHGLHEGRRFSELFDLATYPTAALAHRPVPRGLEFLTWASRKPAVKVELDRITAFKSSDLMRDLIHAAVQQEPEIGAFDDRVSSLIPPLHDRDYLDYAAIRRLIPFDTVRSIILMPFCKLGGADFVASVLAHSLHGTGPVLILRTEQSDWARPDWFPVDVVSVDLSRHLALLSVDQRMRVLYELIRTLKAGDVYNVNSRLAFQTFERFGERLALMTRLHAYYFCADRTPAGVETGYPVWFFANILPYLTTAMIDNADLAETLRQRYCLPPELSARTQVVYTPAMGDVLAQPIARRQVETRASRSRPVLLWAGRFDRQKRFDLVIRIARQMPGIDFHCWGKAVLDAPPDLSDLPANLTVHAPFEVYEDLPLRDSDGWLYTSAWDGVPTILIEVAALGLPIVASASGGVPELIDEETGWLVRSDDDAAFVAAIENMLSNDTVRIERATRLQDRVRSRHSRDAYRRQIIAFSKTAGDSADV